MPRQSGRSRRVCCAPTATRSTVRRASISASAIAFLTRCSGICMLAARRSSPPGLRCPGGCRMAGTIACNGVCANVSAVTSWCRRRVHWGVGMKRTCSWRAIHGPSFVLRACSASAASSCCAGGSARASCCYRAISRGARACIISSRLSASCGSFAIAMSV
jgi:hypothetical protein